jgi:hypothetical protein
MVTEKGTGLLPGPAQIRLLTPTMTFATLPEKGARFRIHPGR